MRRRRRLVAPLLSDSCISRYGEDRSRDGWIVPPSQALWLAGRKETFWIRFVAGCCCCKCGGKRYSPGADTGIWGKSAGRGAVVHVCALILRLRSATLFYGLLIQVAIQLSTSTSLLPSIQWEVFTMFMACHSSANINKGLFVTRQRLKHTQK